MKQINSLTLFLVVLLIGSMLYSCKPEISDQENSSILVGVFNGEGASPVCVIETMEALKIDSGITAREVSSADIMNGTLSQLDVLVFPGGSGSKEYNNLGELAADKVRDFARKDGKGLVGICAGGYLFSTTPDYHSLQITPAPDIREYYDRGRGLISFSLNEQGKEIFPELKDYDSLFIQYYDGPMFETEGHELTILATINTDIATHEGYPYGVSPGKPMLMNGSYGEGNYFIIVGHPEATAGMRWLVPRMARWTAGEPLISYSKHIIRPQINKQAILYYPEIISFEKENFWKLFNEDDSVVLQSLENLHRIRSRPSIRWSIGLLRHPSWEVRYQAAQYLYETEYTRAIPDIEASFRAEQDLEHKALLQNILENLKLLVK
ncbi:MAG: BPL-N domain-containing protein [Bacteroidota bacterium]|nr:BPL-N domain-containing protein [Bacteroidota bacterium]